MKKRNDLKLSVVICSFNRAEILRECLDSILKAQEPEPFEILVIDNNSTDSTKEVVLSYPDVNYILEESIGLSHARNRGIKEAKGKWILFLDDDCKVRETFFYHVFKTIETNKYLLFTGIYKAWYVHQPPKWIPYETGNYVIKNNLKGINDIGNNHVCGNVMCFHKETLQRTTSFPLNLGMNGTQIGYGEESYVEDVYRMNNIPIGINTNIVIYHQVLPHKYKLSWQLRQNYAKGVAAKNRPRIKHTIGEYFTSTLLISMKEFARFFLHRNGKKMISKSIGPILFFIGFFVTKRQE